MDGTSNFSYLLGPDVPGVDFSYRASYLLKLGYEQYLIEWLK